MTVQITPESERIVQSLVSQGAYASDAAVVDEALRLLQRRDELTAEIRRELHELDRGERISSDDVFRGVRAQLGRPSEHG